MEEQQEVHGQGKQGYDKQLFEEVWPTVLHDWEPFLKAAKEQKQQDWLSAVLKFKSLLEVASHGEEGRPFPPFRNFRNATGNHFPGNHFKSLSLKLVCSYFLFRRSFPGVPALTTSVLDAIFHPGAAGGVALEANPDPTDKTQYHVIWRFWLDVLKEMLPPGIKPSTKLGVWYKALKPDPWWAAGDKKSRVRKDAERAGYKHTFSSVLEPILNELYALLTEDATKTTPKKRRSPALEAAAVPPQPAVQSPGTAQAQPLCVLSAVCCVLLLWDGCFVLVAVCCVLCAVCFCCCFCCCC
jgi:hypothetical protein